MHRSWFTGPARNSGAHGRNFRSYRVGVDRLAGRRVTAHHTCGSGRLALRDRARYQGRYFGRLGRPRWDLRHRARTRGWRRRSFHSDLRRWPCRWRTWGTVHRPYERFLRRRGRNLPTYCWNWRSRCATRTEGPRGRNRRLYCRRRWLQHRRRRLRQRLGNANHSWRG